MVAAGLIGAATALLLGADYTTVTFGLFGYNSILTGMAFWSGPFVKANRVTLTLSLFGAVITAVAWMAFSHFMGDIFIQRHPALLMLWQSLDLHPRLSSLLGL